MPPRRRSAKVFDVDRCAIPTVWCGDGALPGIKDGNRYVRKGTASQCMKKGFGAGMMTEKTKNLPATSLQKIRYIGEIHEQNFRSHRIATTTALKNYAIRNPGNIKRFLEGILTKKNGAGVDGRAYNSVILWLYQNGVKDVPPCMLLRTVE